MTQGFDSALISLYMYSGMLTVSSWFNLPKKMDKLQATLQIHWLTVLCLSLLCLVWYGRISCDSATPDYLYSLRGSTRSSRVDGFMDDFFDWYLLTVRRFQPMQLQPATAKKSQTLKDGKIATEFSLVVKMEEKVLVNDGVKILFSRQPSVL